jgi:hypothetical protein
VVRGDVGTVAGHLDALAADVPDLLADAYRDLTRVLLGRSGPALDRRPPPSSTRCSPPPA